MLVQFQGSGASVSQHTAALAMDQRRHAERWLRAGLGPPRWWGSRYSLPAPRRDTGNGCRFRHSGGVGRKGGILRLGSLFGWGLGLTMHGGAAETGMVRMQRPLSRVLLRGPWFSARESGAPTTLNLAGSKRLLGNATRSERATSGQGWGVASLHLNPGIGT